MKDSKKVTDYLLLKQKELMAKLLLTDKQTSNSRSLHFIQQQRRNEAKSLHMRVEACG
jgi:hypothetical protein